MGAIQNAAGGLAQTALGAAVAGKHLKQQEESIKQQEATKKLAGINAAAVTQSQLAENARDYEHNIKEGKAATKNYMGAWTELYKQEDIRSKVYTDSKGRMRTEGGQFYSEKQLQAAVTGERSAKLAVQAIWEDRSRIKAQREILLKKGQAINEIYGEKVFDNPGKLVSNAEKQDAAMKKWHEERKQKAVDPDKIEDPKTREAVKKALEEEKAKHPYTIGGKK